MKFTKEQLDEIEKVLKKYVDSDIVENIKNDLSAKDKQKPITKEKDTTHCISLTKTGKQCSKKPVKGETLCSIHLKQSSVKKVEKQDLSEEKEENIEIPIEEKKREIELLFGKDIE